MNETKAWEVDTLRGHMNNVSSVMFHAKQDIIVSNSEDKSIRFTLRLNLLAAGHDNGMIVFKLERERPAFALSGDSLFYCKDRFLRFYEYSTQKDSQVIPIRRPGRKEGTGGSAVFIARNRFAVLEKSTSQVLVKNLKNEMVKKSPLPIPTDAIFYAGTGNLLCRSEDKVVIFDLQQRLVLGELQTPFVRYVVWSNDMESVALLSKHTIIIASKKLVLQCTLHETIRVKSGAWDDNGVFIYTTLNHIKYCLPNGDSGIIRTLDVPIYITKAMIAYLQQKGFPEVALHFVEDERIRFNLALESGNIGVAVASATQINEKDLWYRLGVEALRQGNSGIVEFAYQQTKNFERLSFLYLITGNLDKLSKLMKIAEVKNNVMGQFHNALYLGDVKERVKILENAGHLPLAYITASVHGLTDVAERLAAELGDNVPTLPEGKTPSLLMPPSPVMCGGDWPLLRVSKEYLKEDLRVQPEEVLDIESIWEKLKEEEEENDGEGGWGLDDLELPPELDTPKVSANARSSVFVTPTQGMPVSQIWSQKSSLAAEQAAAGSFDTAMRLLHRQLGIKNFAPLKRCFLICSVAAIAICVLSRREAQIWLQSHNSGKFTEALRLFLSILQTIPLVVVESRREVDEVKDLVTIVKEYVLGLKMELKRRETKDDPVRQQELAAYFTHCELQAPHLRLAAQCNGSLLQGKEPRHC
ncbi:unnamed protein product [Microthlaspi erraticum]|uniref:Coatomer WD associated region domain-containing protein n=1 Tax=Microthlaspi erraticum TaxID=1685480 RepID=A0A6D2KKR7_9BRAS|nr:unnamed protein product [Microthlaspi erraticum]